MSPIVRMRGAEPTLQGMLQPGQGVSPAVEIASAQPALLQGCILYGLDQRQALGKLVSHPRQSSSAAKAGRVPSLCHTKCHACLTAQERSDNCRKS